MGGGGPHRQAFQAATSRSPPTHLEHLGVQLGLEDLDLLALPCGHGVCAGRGDKRWCVCVWGGALQPRALWAAPSPRPRPPPPCSNNRIIIIIERRKHARVKCLISSFFLRSTSVSASTCAEGRAGGWMGGGLRECHVPRRPRHAARRAAARPTRLEQTEPRPAPPHAIPHPPTHPPSPGPPPAPRSAASPPPRSRTPLAPRARPGGAGGGGWGPGEARGLVASVRARTTSCALPCVALPSPHHPPPMQEALTCSSRLISPSSTPSLVYRTIRL